MTQQGSCLVQDVKLSKYHFRILKFVRQVRELLEFVFWRSMRTSEFAIEVPEALCFEPFFHRRVMLPNGSWGWRLDPLIALAVPTKFRHASEGGGLMETRLRMEIADERLLIAVSGGRIVGIATDDL